MSTSLDTPTVPVDQVHVHPKNARRLAVADEEMVDSIRSTGIAQALTIMPFVNGVCPLHETCYTLGAGHRRLDGAVKAGLDVVPVMFRDDLVTEAQQLEFMLVENLHRVDLTAVEEAEAYEQLTLSGMDVDAIAAATGRKASTIKARLQLVGLAETSRDRLHAGEMTLLDAEALLEFADDPETTKTLEAAIGTSNFRWAVEDAKRARVRTAARAAAIAVYVEAGAFEVTSVPGQPGRVVRVDDETGEELQSAGMHMFPEDLRDPDAHDGCLAYLVPTSQWQDPYPVCTDRGRHPIPEAAAAPQPVESEWEKKRAEREAKAAARATASAVRVEWLRDHFTAMFPVKSHGPLAKAAKAFLPGMVGDTGGEHLGNETLLTALGVVPDPEVDVPSWRAHRAARAACAGEVGAANPTKVLATFAAVLATQVADMLATEADWFTDHDQMLQQLALWDWLKAAGYPMSDVDVEIRTELEVKHTELAEAS